MVEEGSCGCLFDRTEAPSAHMVPKLHSELGRTFGIMPRMCKASNFSTGKAVVMDSGFFCTYGKRECMHWPKRCARGSRRTGIFADKEVVASQHVYIPHLLVLKNDGLMRFPGTSFWTMHTLPFSVSAKTPLSNHKNHCPSQQLCP